MRKHTYICPYCFEEHNFEDVVFRCKNDLCSKKRPDEKYAEYVGEKASCHIKNETFYDFDNKKIHFLKKRHMPKEAVCPFCGMKTDVRLCPDCHQNLPDMASYNDTLIIAVFGGFDSGLSTYLSVLIHELEYSIIPCLMKGKFRPADDRVFKRYLDEYYVPNYIDGTKILHNQWERPKPFMYELWTPIDKRGKKIRKIMIVFYDENNTAWGRLEGESRIKGKGRYAATADGIIFLADPFRFREICAELEDTESAGSSCIEKLHMNDSHMQIDRIAMLRNAYGVEKLRMIDIPIAIVLSKFDVLTRFFPTGSLVSKQSGYLGTGNYDKNELLVVSNEIIEMFEKWGMSWFCENVARNLMRETERLAVKNREFCKQSVEVAEDIFC